MGHFLAIFCFFWLPVFLFTALRIWRPAEASNGGRSVADRIAWTGFALGVCLMFNMVLYAKLLESDGDYRSWDTIRLHGHVLLAMAAFSVVAPVGVVLYQATRAHRPEPKGKKSLTDDFE